MKYTAKLAAYYKALWEGLTVSPPRVKEAETWARKILANKSRYQKIEQATGVPWHFVALAHYRESTLNFQKNLCNGQPLGMRTTIVPIGRGPYKDFEESAYDALVRIKGYSAKLDWSVAPYIHRIEGYNGYGYHGKGIPSPYLVGGSNKQMRGKYTRDHYFDPNHWDTQLGVLTLLKALMALDPSINFGAVIVAKPPVPSNTTRNTTTGGAVIAGGAAAAGAGAWFESYMAAGLTFGIVAMLAATMFILWKRK